MVVRVVTPLLPFVSSLTDNQLCPQYTLLVFIASLILRLCYGSCRQLIIGNFVCSWKINHFLHSFSRRFGARTGAGTGQGFILVLKKKTRTNYWKSMWTKTKQKRRSFLQSLFFLKIKLNLIKWKNGLLVSQRECSLFLAVIIQTIKYRNMFQCWMCQFNSFIRPSHLQ